MSSSKLHILCPLCLLPVTFDKTTIGQMIQDVLGSSTILHTDIYSHVLYSVSSKKTDKNTNNGPQNSTQKTKDWGLRTPLKTEVNSCTPERYELQPLQLDPTFNPHKPANMTHNPELQRLTNISRILKCQFILQINTFLA